VCQPKRTEDGKIVRYKKNERQAVANGIRGLAELVEMDKADKKGIPIIDTSLTDTEQVPFIYEGGIQSFFEKEVAPYSPDAWIDEKQTKIGYEISFTKYFYKPITLRPLEEITADIKKLEAETKGLLEKIVEG
jgi:type I restriction enzyme M protein